MPSRPPASLVIRCFLLASLTFVMTGVQYSCVQTEEGHWWARVQRPSHQPHSVTRDDSKQEGQVVR